MAKNNPQSSDDTLDVVFSPQQIARLGTEYIEERARQKGVGIPLYLPKIDADFLPALPGDLISIISRPGGGKTAMMLYWARKRARVLQEQGISSRAVVYVTYEQHIEDLHAFCVASDSGLPVDKMARGLLSDADMENVRMQGVKRVGLPLWFVGHSQARRKRRPRLTLTNVANALTSIEEWEEQGRRGYMIDMLFIDYLQRVPIEDKAESKVVGLDITINRIKDAALAFACPVVLGVQARREVDGYMLPVPQMTDGQWCSSTEQVSDKIFSLVRPCKYRKQGEQFGKVLVDGRNQILISLLKQKLGADNLAYWMSLAPEYNRFEDVVETEYDLNDHTV